MSELGRRGPQHLSHERGERNLGSVLVCVGGLAPVCALLNPIAYLALGSAFPTSYDERCKCYLAGFAPVLWDRFEGSGILAVVPPCFMANLHWAAIMQSVL